MLRSVKKIDGYAGLEAKAACGLDQPRAGQKEPRHRDRQDGVPARDGVMAAYHEGLNIQRDPQLEVFDGHVSDSDEGRRTLQAAIGTADFANHVLSAMPHAFGGHLENPAGGTR